MRVKKGLRRSEAEDAQEEATAQEEEARDETDRALWELKGMRQEIDIAIRVEMIVLLNNNFLRLEAAGGSEQNGHSRGTLNKGGSTVLVESTTSRSETLAQGQGTGVETQTTGKRMTLPALSKFSGDTRQDSEAF